MSAETIDTSATRMKITNICAVGLPSEDYGCSLNELEQLITYLVEVYEALVKMSYNGEELEPLIIETLLAWSFNLLDKSVIDGTDHYLRYVIGKKHGFLSLVKQWGSPKLKNFLHDISSKYMDIKLLSRYCIEICNVFECFEDTLEHCSVLIANNDRKSLWEITILLLSSPPYD